MNCISEMIRHTSIKYENLLSKLIEPLQRHLGAHYFCYQFVSNTGDWFTLGNRPDWLLYSAENQFYKNDPSLVHPKHSQSGICFPKYHQHDAFQETLITKAIDVFDIDHALALIEPNINGCEYYFFAAPRKHTAILNYYLKYINMLRRDYIRYVQINIKPIHDVCLEHSVNLHEINPSRFISAENLLIESERNHDMSFSNELRNTPALTKREHQCLVLYQKGYTAKETAYQLAISYRTVEKIFENVKFKFGVKTKRDLAKEPLLS